MKYPAVSTAAQPKNPALQNPSIHLYMHRKHEGTMRAFREQPAYIAAMKSMKALTLKQITVASHVLQINDEYFNDYCTQYVIVNAQQKCKTTFYTRRYPLRFLTYLLHVVLSFSLCSCASCILLVGRRR
uniref:Uncharacterized protein n=1 Tax=Lotharella globosa TaxID=91324 RepID=A0A7S3ZG11_9EUKA